MGWDPIQDIAFLEDDYSITPLEKGWADALIAYEVPLAMARAAGYRPMDIDMQSWNDVGAAEMPKKPYPAVDGIKRVMQLFDSAAMRRFKPEDFYDDSFMRELEQSGFLHFRSRTSGLEKGEQVRIELVLVRVGEAM